MTIEAMRQALEALKLIDEAMPFPVAKHAMSTLLTAIAEAEKQEPVAWANINKHGDITHTNNKRMPWSKTPLYTTPPAAQPCPYIRSTAEGTHHCALSQRQPLTDEELRAIENKINPNMRWRSSDEEGITLYPIEYYELVRAIEAAHGITGDKK